MKNIILIVGTRPNFVKAAPLYLELKNNNKFNTQIIHTGQHYDTNMSQIFFDQLGLSGSGATNDPFRIGPDITYLDIQPGTQNTQLAGMMIGLESEFLKQKPDLVVVFGDVTSTLAGAMTANKMGIRVCHVEAGNRSFDRSMPEEINRLLTDTLSDYHFIAEPYAMDNMRNEGLLRNPVLEYQNAFYVGNIMIDTLVRLKPRAAELTTYLDMGLVKGEYILVTLHRPANVDDTINLHHIFDALTEITDRQIVFPVHPRRHDTITQMLRETYHDPPNIILTEPMGYLEFMNLNMNCGLMVTDSGGLQEETTVLGIPCLTLRPNTERVITCTHGTNYLLTRLSKQSIIGRIEMAFRGTHPMSDQQIPMWDGKTAGRIVDIIETVILK
jgi:UDP-N-acetylglucosamine 2-epimerase (non-hydrolysing)